MIYLMAIEDAERLSQETENFVKLGRLFSVSMIKKPEKKLKNYVFIIFRLPNECGRVEMSSYQFPYS